MEYTVKRKAETFENSEIFTGSINKFIAMQDPYKKPEGVVRRELVAVSVAANHGGVVAVITYDETREVDDAEIEEWLHTQPACDPDC